MTKVSPRVLVLLSMYNGERYLAMQLDSLIAQQHPVDILIRDDGSTDRSCDIVRSYMARYPSITLVEGQNLGAGKSFFELIKTAPAHYDYYAFCDQDDVWTAEKIARAVHFFSEREASLPTLYFSHFTLTDAELQVQGDAPRFPRYDISVALLQNIPWGCTEVWNAAAQRLLQARHPEFFYMHDWWVFLVLSAIGSVHFDPVSTVLYRVHSRNVFGQTDSFFSRFRNRLRLIATRDLPVLSAWRQAVALERHFADLMPADRRAVVEEFIGSKTSFWRRLRFVFLGKARRAFIFDNVLFRIMIFFNYY